MEISLKPLVHQTLRERVVGALKRFILENNLRSGDHLPSEQELARQLAVGRSSVREAMKSLEIIGVIESRPKVGCTLKSMDLSLLSGHIPFSPGVSGVTVAEILEAREFLEVNIIPQVVRKGDPEVLADMAEGLRMAEEIAPGDWRKAEMRFHAALFRGAHNAVLQSFNEVIQGFFAGWQARGSASTPGHRKWLEDHRKIYAALKNGDTALAQALMRAHLRWYAGILIPSVAPVDPQAKQVA